MTPAVAHVVTQTAVAHTVTQTTDAHTVTQTGGGHTVEAVELVLPSDLYVLSTDVHTIVALSQAEYDALSPPDPSTLYVIT